MKIQDPVYRIQDTAGRRQKAEGRRQQAAGRRQKAAGRRQKAEVIGVGFADGFVEKPRPGGLRRLINSECGMRK